MRSLQSGMGSAGMLPAVRGILPRTLDLFHSPSKIMTLRAAEIPSGNMPEGASRMLALPESTILHERNHYP
ncbi:MAG: hypothetical protein WBX14_11425 [Candidatus Udaeobacter sp.]